MSSGPEHNQGNFFLASIFLFTRLELVTLYEGNQTIHHLY